MSQNGNCQHGFYELRDGGLFCNGCGEPSPSTKWKSNAYGIKAAEEMTEVERRVSALSQKEKDALLVGIFTRDGLIHHDVVLSPEQAAIVTERRLKRALSPLDIRGIRARAPKELHEAVVRAEGALKDADEVLTAALEVYWKKVATRQKLGEQWGDSAFGPRTVSSEIEKKYKKAREEEDRTEALVKEAELAIEPGSALRVAYAKAVSALDSWAYDEQVRLRDEKKQKERAEVEAKKKSEKPLRERIADVR